MIPILRVGIAVLMAPPTLAGCAYVPRSGPTTSAVLDGGLHAGEITKQKLPYVLIPLGGQTVSAVLAADHHDADAAAAFSLANLPPPGAVGVVGQGDVLKITMWEPDPTGVTLIGPARLDMQAAVAANGDIPVPYVGRLHVAGRTPGAVAATIQSVLASEGHKIQVAVFDASSLSDSVIVEGSVRHPGRVMLTENQRTLLDGLALAGGASIPLHEAQVRVTRHGITASVPLARLVEGSTLDVALSPGDQVMVVPRRRFFYALGAVNAPGAHPYDAKTMTLTQALGKIAGLNDSLASPRGVFVYRHQSPTVTEAVDPSATAGASNLSQVVYHLDMRKPDAFFVANLFQVRPNDVIYVSNAPIANLAKVLQVISGVSNLAGTPRNFGAGY